MEAIRADHADINIYTWQNDKDFLNSLQFRAQENNFRLEEDGGGASSKVDGEAK